MAGVIGRCRHCGSDDRYADGWEAGYLAGLEEMVDSTDQAPQAVRRLVQALALHHRRLVDDARRARGLVDA